MKLPYRKQKPGQHKRNPRKPNKGQRHGTLVNPCRITGEFEQKFLDEGRIYLTWDELNNDLSKLDSRQMLLELLQQVYPNEKLKRLQNHSSQLWPFANVMQPGDWVVLPSKKQPVVYVGRITGDYVYNPTGPDSYYHWRSVEWFGQEIPRAFFGQDLLYSFGAFMTICRIQRNNALERLQAMYKNGWQAEKSRHRSMPA